MTKALFLDRDGIINVDHGYIYKQEDFQFVDGIFELCQVFQTHGYEIFVITNQSGIGRGYYTQGDFLTLSRWMVEEFAAHGVSIAKVLYCPHTPEENCHCRKPETGMVEEVMRDWELDLSSSWVIGDKHSDIKLAHNANIGKCVFIGDHEEKDAHYCYPTLREFYFFLEENEVLKDYHVTL